MYEEEIDVTEIYFILKGTFGVAFNSFNQTIDRALAEEILDESELKAPEDMKKNGHVIALIKNTFSFIGDYYVLSSKPS